MDRGGGEQQTEMVSQMILQERKQFRFVVFTCFQVAQRVAFIRVNLQLVGFVGFDQTIHQH